MVQKDGNEEAHFLDKKEARRFCMLMAYALNNFFYNQFVAFQWSISLVPKFSSICSFFLLYEISIFTHHKKKKKLLYMKFKNM